MTETIAIETLLKGILSQTTVPRTSTLTPNMSVRSFEVDWLDFTDFKIQPGDFERILRAITELKLLIYPRESLMGWIEGYHLYDINMLTKEAVLVMAFSDKNIPASHTLEALFSMCHTLQNIHLMSLLDTWRPIKEKYTDYSY